MFQQVFALDRDPRGLERLANLAQRQAVDDLDGVFFFWVPHHIPAWRRKSELQLGLRMT